MNSDSVRSQQQLRLLMPLGEITIETPVSVTSREATVSHSPIDQLLTKNLQLNENTDGFVTQIRLADTKLDNEIASNLMTAAPAADFSRQIQDDNTQHNFADDDDLKSDKPVKQHRLHVEFNEKIQTKPSGNENNSNKFETITPVATPITTGDDYGLSLSALDQNEDYRPIGSSIEGKLFSKANPNSPNLNSYRTPRLNNQAQNNEFLGSNVRSYQSLNLNPTQSNPSFGLAGGANNKTAAAQEGNNSSFNKKSEKAFLHDLSSSSSKKSPTHLPDIYKDSKFPNRGNFSNRRIFVKYITNKVEKNNEFAYSIKRENETVMTSMSITSSSVGGGGGGNKPSRMNRNPSTRSKKSSVRNQETSFWGKQQVSQSHAYTSAVNNAYPSYAANRNAGNSGQARGPLFNNVIDLNFIGDKCKLQSHFLFNTARHLSDLNLNEAWPRSNMCKASIKSNPWVSSFKARNYANEINSSFRANFIPASNGGSSAAGASRWTQNNFSLSKSMEAFRSNTVFPPTVKIRV